MSRNAMPREFYIPKGATKIADKKSDAVAYIYELNGAPYALAFFAKQAKPVWHHRFRNDASRSKHIAETFTARQETIAYKAKQDAERKAWRHDYKVGDVLRTCWGYDQTNVEFFEVTEVTGKMLTLRELRAESISTGDMQGKCVPLPGSFKGQPIRKLAQQHGVRIDSCRLAQRCEVQTIAGVPVYKPAHFSTWA